MSVFLLGLAAPLLIGFGGRWLMAHAEVVARDTAPLLVLAVFALFTVFALRLLPGRRLFAVALLYAGAALGIAAEALTGAETGRQVLVEVFVIWWLALPAVLAGVLLERVWRGRRRAPRAARD